MQISENIHLLKHPFKVVFGPDKFLERFVYSMIIFDDTITLVDCGTRDSVSRIVDYITQQRRAPEDIQTLILSHAHPDHMGCAAALKRKYGCKVMAHPNEKAWIEDIDTQIRERPVPGFKLLTDESVIVDETLEDGQRIGAGKNISLTVMHAPGHSAGQICLLFNEDRILFTADAVPLPSDIPNYDNYGDTMATLERIESSNDCDTLLSSWADPLTTPKDIQQFIHNGKSYLTQIDTAVQKHYHSPEFATEPAPLENCTKVITTLGLPPLFINPITDRAFRSHLK